jgi:MFS family permease
MRSTTRPIQLGLRANWQQFALLVVVNAFVGSIVGIERAIMPLLAEEDFGVVSRAAILSFLVTFGAAKAVSNLAAGVFAQRFGRRRVLIAGWLVGLAMPPLVIAAPSWGWVVAAHALLGINQGLCWSMTVTMKVDLAGPARRGFALGLNEFAGYLAVGVAAFAAAYVATTSALRPGPFVLAFAIALIGLTLSIGAVKDTNSFIELESDRAAPEPFARVFATTTWRNRDLSAASQAGLVNNLNDGMAWGLLPLFFAAGGTDIAQIGVLAGTYPVVWGVAQLGTGALSDRIGRKLPIVLGMWLQALAIASLVAYRGMIPWAIAMVGLGIGTALVYPTLLAAVSDVAKPEWRAAALGTYRFWRDSGYLIGAVLAGVLADRIGIDAAIASIAVVTAISGLFLLLRMRETLATGSPGALPSGAR